MKTLLPTPLLSLAVALVWLLLVGTLAPVHLLTAAVLAVLLPRVAQRLLPDNVRMARPLLAAALFMRVLGDIVVSNIEVARRILGREAKLRPAFIWIPLDIQNPYGIATLAGIITMTPGTLSSELSLDRRHLLVHCFHLEDAGEQIATIKRRYEAPLREIFP